MTTYYLVGRVMRHACSACHSRTMKGGYRDDSGVLIADCRCGTRDIITEDEVKEVPFPPTIFRSTIEV